MDICKQNGKGKNSFAHLKYIPVYEYSHFLSRKGGELINQGTKLRENGPPRPPVSNLSNDEAIALFSMQLYRLLPAHNFAHHSQAML